MQAESAVRAWQQVGQLRLQVVRVENRHLVDQYPVLYSGPGGLVAHECILDTRGFKGSAGIEVGDIAKRLIDYGFHPPTVSFPVAGTLMVEPTESEPLEELDRFIEAMRAIREEIREVETGAAERGRNVVSGAPHTMEQVASDSTSRISSRIARIASMKRSSSSSGSLSVGSTMSVPATGNETVGGWNP